MDKKKAALRRRLDRLLQIHKSKFWIADGHCLERVKHKPFESFGISWSALKLMVDDILDRPQPWDIRLYVFCVDESGKGYAKAETALKPKERMVSSEIGEIASDQLQKLIEAQNERHYISAGWYAVPTDKYDLTESDAEIIELFRSWGAFDIETVALAMQVRPQEGRNGNAEPN